MRRTRAPERAGRPLASLRAAAARGAAACLAGAALAAAALAAAAPAPAAADPAAGVLDQHNDLPSLARARCDIAGRSLFQSFHPAATPLAAVALEARAVPSAGEHARVRVRAGGPDGPVLGEAQADITQDGWVEFEFAAELLVELGGYYVIEWVEPQSWWACRDDDPYARGEAYNCGGFVLPTRDFNFRTWAPAAHWELRTWGEVKQRFAEHGTPASTAAQLRGSTSIRVEGGSAR